MFYYHFFFLLKVEKLALRVQETLWKWNLKYLSKNNFKKIVSIKNSFFCGHASPPLFSTLQISILRVIKTKSLRWKIEFHSSFISFLALLRSPRKKAIPIPKKKRFKTQKELIIMISAK